MAKAEQEKVGFLGRMKQVGQVFSFTFKNDKWFLPLVAGAVAIPVVFTVVALLLGWGLLFLPLGIMLSLLAVLIVLNLRSNKVFMSAMEGQPGACTRLVENMRGDWRVTPAISSTTQLDMVHLVLGRPGVILLAEGHPQRVRALLGQEKRRLSKVIGSAPLYDLVLGPDENQVPIRKLRVTLMKLPRNLKGKEINALDKRLTALSARPRMPKGAIPKEMMPKGLRPPKGATRGR
jgi:Domain of unknown function (DUF4191)